MPIIGRAIGGLFNITIEEVGPLIQAKTAVRPLMPIIGRAIGGLFNITIEGWAAYSSINGGEATDADHWPGHWGSL